LKEEALDRTLWKTRFGRGYGPVVRQTAEWMNCIRLCKRKAPNIIIPSLMYFTWTSPEDGLSVEECGDCFYLTNSAYNKVVLFAWLFGFYIEFQWHNTHTKFHGNRQINHNLKLQHPQYCDLKIYFNFNEVKDKKTHILTQKRLISRKGLTSIW
jgi:hypothetical protein